MDAHELGSFPQRGWEDHGRHYSHPGYRRAKTDRRSPGKIEEIRIKEIHHRIKNNLQFLSSLLGLEAERFSDAKLLETLRVSQNRVVSMALIHEELYEGEKIDILILLLISENSLQRF